MSVLENEKTAILILKNIYLPLYWLMGAVFMLLARQIVTGAVRVRWSTAVITNAETREDYFVMFTTIHSAPIIWSKII